MKISELMAELERIRVAEGDLVVTHFSAEKHWEPVAEVTLQPAGRPHGPRGNVYAEKVVVIGDEW